MIGSKAEFKHTDYHFVRHHTGNPPKPLSYRKPWLTIIGETLGVVCFVVFLAVIAVFL